MLLAIKIFFKTAKEIATWCRSAISTISEYIFNFLVKPGHCQILFPQKNPSMVKLPLCCHEHQPNLWVNITNIHFISSYVAAPKISSIQHPLEDPNYIWFNAFCWTPQPVYPPITTKHHADHPPQRHLGAQIPYLCAAGQGHLATWHWTFHLATVCPNRCKGSPICSMYGIYLPTLLVDFEGKSMWTQIFTDPWKYFNIHCFHV